MSAGEVAATLRVRMSTSDAHYAGNLVAGARLMGLFGDLATEILVRFDGDEGLLRAFDSVEFLAPVQAGDYIRAEARLIEVGSSSRRISFAAYKDIEPAPQFGPTAAAPLTEPVLVARAEGVAVVPHDRQRTNRGKTEQAVPPSSDPNT